jgi:hypothetical protein
MVVVVKVVRHDMFGQEPVAVPDDFYREIPLDRGRLLATIIGAVFLGVFIAYHIVKR